MRYEMKTYSNFGFFLEVENLLKKKLEYGDSIEFYKEIRYMGFIENNLDRFRLITNQAKSFLIEENCRDDVWKELYTLCKPNSQFENNLICIHFWNCTFDELEKNIEIRAQSIVEGYLGYVVLKLTPDYNLMPSIIVPNWNELEYINNKNILTYKKVVCIADSRIVIETMPFYFQDNVFVKSTHTKMLMFSLFGHHTYDLPQLSIVDMIEKSRCYPMIRGEIPYFDMLEIFKSNNIPVRAHRTSEEKCRIGEISEYIEILEKDLRRGMPVIIYKGDQVFLVVGYTEEKEKQYIVYDDSGYFLPLKKCSKGFINLIRGKDLFSDLTETYMIMAV